MPKRKYTRKQLRQPDEFITLSMRAWELIRSHASRVIVMVVVAVLIISGVWIWTYFQESRASKATRTLTRAFDIYDQDLLVEDEKVDPKKIGDVPRFKTRKEKLSAAEKEFDKVISASGGALERMALLMRAGVRYDQGLYDKAIEDYQRFLKSSDEQRFRTLATEGLAYAYEARKDWKNALETFRKLSSAGEAEWEKKFHEARILVKQGKSKDATKIFLQIIEKAKDRALVERSYNQLALVGVK